MLQMILKIKTPKHSAYASNTSILVIIFRETWYINNDLEELPTHKFQDPSLSNDLN